MSTFEERASEQIEELLGRIETTADPATRASVQQLVQALMDLHGAGIERMLEITAAAGAPGEAIVEGFAGDALVSNLLLLYGLHPLDLQARISRALAQVRPHLASHDSDVELLGVGTDGVVRLRLQGSGHGSPSAALTLKGLIEEAITAAAPDVLGLEVEDGLTLPVRAPDFIPLIRVA